MTREFVKLRTWGVSFLQYEPEQAPFLYIKYKDRAFIFSTKTTKSGSGIVQIQGEDNPDEIEIAYNVGKDYV